MTSSKTDKGGKFLYNILFNYSTILSFSEHTFCHLQCAYFTCTNGNNMYTNHFGRIFIFFVLLFFFAERNQFQLISFCYCRGRYLEYELKHARTDDTETQQNNKTKNHSL